MSWPFLPSMQAWLFIFPVVLFLCACLKSFRLRCAVRPCLHAPQVGKGRDVGLGQITGFVAKISMGNGMQARSREVTTRRVVK